ncbi:MAG: hypothetical protein ROW52_04850 [Anaerolineaceae bacterium]
MFEMSIPDLLLSMSVALFAIGAIAAAVGVFVLTSRVLSGDIKGIARQTSRLAQKGITDDVAGLVGNASALIESLNRLVQTTSGIGIFLFVAGCMLVAAAYFLLRQVG